MALILHIDTAVDIASICLAKDGQLLQFDSNAVKRDHAAWLHVSIAEQIRTSGFSMQQLDAVAVTIGPGSYTGLRVGLATAKGLCYALNIPLLAINTLEMMASATIDQDADLFCPMIDARRMEVFTSIYDKHLKSVLQPKAMILNSSAFDEWLSANTILFSGNGAEKLKPILHHKNAMFTDIRGNAANMIKIAGTKFTQNDFSDVAYTEPFYLKEFYSPAQ